MGPIIETSEKLAEFLDVSENFLYFVTNKKEDCYNVHSVKKRNGIRIISNPNNTLKIKQRIILKKILYSFATHPCANGFVPEKNILDNCKDHVGKKVIYILDIKDFFPSITAKRVSGLFKFLGYKKRVKFLLTELCTFQKKLPQGAPTSPSISNLICKRMDSRLFGLAKSFNLTYTRYADDMTFSGDNISKKTKVYIKKIIKEEGFNLAKSKERTLTQKNAQKVTGLIVNNKVSIGRKNYKILKATIYNCVRYSACSQNTHQKNNFKKYLYGKVNFLNSIDSKKAKLLKNMLKKVNWDSHSYLANEWIAYPLSIEIIELMLDINRLVDTKMFKDNNKNIIDLLKPSHTKEEFCARIHTLEKFFDNMDLNYFYKLLGKDGLDGDGNKKKSRMLIKSFTDLKQCPLAKINDSLWNIKKLGAGIFRHDLPEKDIKKVMKYYNIDKNFINFSEFWFSVVKDLRSSLREFKEFF